MREEVAMSMDDNEFEMRVMRIKAQYIYPERVIVYCAYKIPWAMWPINDETVICPRCKTYIDSRVYSLSPTLRAKAEQKAPLPD